MKDYIEIGYKGSNKKTKLFFVVKKNKKYSRPFDRDSYDEIVMEFLKEWVEFYCKKNGK